MKLSEPVQNMDRGDNQKMETHSEENEIIIISESEFDLVDFFRRILEFGYITHFYKTPLAPWITKPSAAKVHSSDRKLSEEESTERNRSEIRELSEEEAKRIISIFPNIVRRKRYSE